MSSMALPVSDDRCGLSGWCRGGYIACQYVVAIFADEAGIGLITQIGAVPVRLMVLDK